MKRLTAIILIVSASGILYCALRPAPLVLLAAAFSEDPISPAEYLNFALPILIIPVFVGLLLVAGAALLYSRGSYPAALMAAAAMWLVVGFWLVTSSPNSPLTPEMTQELTDTLGNLQDTATGSTSNQPPISRNPEITENPNIALDSSVKFLDLKAYGVRLGDPQTRVPDNCPLHVGGAGDNAVYVYECPYGIEIRGYRGLVEEIIIKPAADSLISQVGISSERNLRTRIGEALQTPKNDGFTIEYYQYQDEDASRTVRWDQQKNQITEIDLFRSAQDAPLKRNLPPSSTP